MNYYTKTNIYLTIITYNLSYRYGKDVIVLHKTNLHFNNLFDLESLKKEINEKKYINELNELFELKKDKDIENKFIEKLNEYPLLRSELLDFILYKNETILIRNKEYIIKEHLHQNSLTKDDKVFWLSFLYDTGFIYFFKNELADMEKILFFIKIGNSTHKRKNIVGKINEEKIESILTKHNIEFNKQVTIKMLKELYDYNVLSPSQKRYDYVFYIKEELYLLETNYFNSRGGSKIDDSISKMLVTSKSEKANFIYISGGAYWENKNCKINELKKKMNFLLLEEFEDWIKQKNLI